MNSEELLRRGEAIEFCLLTTFSSLRNFWKECKLSLSRGNESFLKTLEKLMRFNEKEAKE